MTASITADYISGEFLGFTSVFQFDIGQEVAPRYYWHIVILGVLLGVMGAFYNKMTIWVQGCILRQKGLNETTRLLIPFFAGRRSGAFAAGGIGQRSWTY